MSLCFPFLQQAWTISLQETATFGAQVGNFPLLGEQGGSRQSCSLGGGKEGAGAWAGGWAGWGGSSPSAASYRMMCLASPWAQGGENEGPEPLAIWGRQIPEELPFPPGSPMGCWLSCCPTTMGAAPPHQMLCTGQSPRFAGCARHWHHLPPGTTGKTLHGRGVCAGRELQEPSCPRPPRHYLWCGTELS